MSESQAHIALPTRSVAGRTVLTANWCNSVRESLGRLASRGANELRVYSPTIYPPFTVALKIIAGEPVT